MVHGFQFFLEDGLDRGDVLEGNRAFLEVSFLYLTVDDFLHQVGNAFFRIFRQTSGSRFHRVGHHQDGLFLGKRIRSRILERFLVDYLIGVFVLVRDVEIFGQSRTVMRTDEVLDDLWQVVFVGQFRR